MVMKFACNQRSDGDVGYAGLARGKRQPEFIEGVRALFFADGIEPRDEIGREELGDGLPECIGARPGEQHLHLRVPALDPVIEIDSKDADVDGFDDVLVELLEPLEVGDLLLESAIELRVLNGDADVAGQRFEHLHLFAGEKVSISCAA